MVHSLRVPDGQDRSHPAPGHVTSHAQLCEQSTSPQELLVVHRTAHRPSPHSIDPQALLAVHAISHEAALPQSMLLHAPGALHEIVHAKPVGHSITMHWDGFEQPMLQVIRSTSQPALHALGHSGSGGVTQKPSSQTRPPVHCASVSHSKSFDRRSTKQLAIRAVAHAATSSLTGALRSRASRRHRRGSASE
jgi:hypothetical protein